VTRDFERANKNIIQTASTYDPTARVIVAPLKALVEPTVLSFLVRDPIRFVDESVPDPGLSRCHPIVVDFYHPEKWLTTDHQQMPFCSPTAKVVTAP
jgi:hypothetical protein